MLYRRGKAIVGSKMPPPAAEKPKQSSSDYSEADVTKYRVAEAEQAIQEIKRVVFEMRDEFRDFIATQKANALHVCPAPGTCVPLGVAVRELKTEVDQLKGKLTYARGAIWGAGAVAGAIGGLASIAVTVGLKFLFGK
jgi:hypothetical protein